MPQPNPNYPSQQDFAATQDQIKQILGETSAGGSDMARKARDEARQDSLVVFDAWAAEQASEITLQRAAEAEARQAAEDAQRKQFEQETARQQQLAEATGKLATATAQQAETAKAAEARQARDAEALRLATLKAATEYAALRDHVARLANAFEAALGGNPNGSQAPGPDSPQEEETQQPWQGSIIITEVPPEELGTIEGEYKEL